MSFPHDKTILFTFTIHKLKRHKGKTFYSRRDLAKCIKSLLLWRKKRSRRNQNLFLPINRTQILILSFNSLRRSCHIKLRKINIYRSIHRIHVPYIMSSLCHIFDEDSNLTYTFFFLPYSLSTMFILLINENCTHVRQVGRLVGLRVGSPFLPVC